MCCAYAQKAVFLSPWEFQTQSNAILQCHVIDLTIITGFRGRICWGTTISQKLSSNRISVCHSRIHRSGQLHVFPLFLVYPTSFSLGRFTSGAEFLLQRGYLLRHGAGSQEIWGQSVNPLPLERQMHSFVPAAHWQWDVLFYLITDIADLGTDSFFTCLNPAQYCATLNIHGHPRPRHFSNVNNYL